VRGFLFDRKICFGFWPFFIAVVEVAVVNRALNSTGVVFCYINFFAVYTFFLVICLKIRGIHFLPCGAHHKIYILDLMYFFSVQGALFQVSPETTGCQ